MKARPFRSLLGLLVVTLSSYGCGADDLPAASDEAAAVEGSEILAACSATSARAGQLDASFGANGMARVSFGADDDGGYFGLDVIGDNVVAAGWGAGGLGAIRFRLAGLDTSGKPNPAFGSGGQTATSWGPGSNDAAYSFAVGHQRDGGIIAMGHHEGSQSGNADIALARYASDGSLGGAPFGVNGKSLIDLGGHEEIRGGLVLSNDAILVVGRRDDAVLVARATPQGALDSSFARPTGYATVKVGSSAVARAVTVDANGRILVAGSADVSGKQQMFLLRLTAAGALDTSFGQRGRVVSSSSIDERAVSVALSPDGRIVVAGDTGSDGAHDFVVRRFLADGSADVAFGSEGVARLRYSYGDAQAESMVVLPGGGILVVGNSGEGQTLLVRYTCNGALDTAFGVQGVQRIYLGEFGRLNTVRRFSNDRILLGGADVGASPGTGTYGVVVRMWM